MQIADNSCGPPLFPITWLGYIYCYFMCGALLVELMRNRCLPVEEYMDYIRDYLQEIHYKIKKGRNDFEWYK
jgi:hypothetical protein